MEKYPLKKYIAAGLMLITAIFLYYGTFLPYQKSLLAVSALESKESLDEAIQYSSPIGGEETLRHAMEEITTSLEKLGKEDAETASFLGFSVEEAQKSIIDRGKGLQYVKTLTFAARLHQLVWIKTRDSHFAVLSETLYKQCLEKSPRRPQCLIGLFELYLSGGNITDAKEIGKEILLYWPTSNGVRTILEKISTQ